MHNSNTTLSLTLRRTLRFGRRADLIGDKECKCGYINEIELLKQFEKLIEKIDIDEIGIKEKIKAEVERFKKFQQVILGVKGEVVVADIDIRNYAKYVLRGGKDLEKRELAGMFQKQNNSYGKGCADAVNFLAYLV